VGGLRFTPTQLGLALGLLSSVVGALYGGFVMYQKVEEIASLDLGAYAQQMQQTSDKIETQEKLLDSIEQNLRDAKQLTYDIEKRVNDKVVYFEGKMDKFEAKVDATKAELEDKIQKALDNPLAN
jgi:Skp family chaperone for outer membrane proteins